LGRHSFKYSPAAPKVSDLLRQVDELDTNIQECISEWIRSAECRAIDDLVAFFRAETPKITWETISILFQLSQSILRGLLRRREKPIKDDESLDLTNADSSDPDNFLTKGDDCALQWI
jgi:hypothetical protein